MDYQAILNVIEKELKDMDFGGTVPDYIPELEAVPRDKFGMHLFWITGDHYAFGDSEELFSVQSITKVFTLTLARLKAGRTLWKRVGVEPSGTPFNSLIELEKENGIPRNPFINSGALVIADVLVSNFDDPKAELLNFVHRLTGETSIAYNFDIMESEKKFGYRNRALVNFMKDLGNIENEVDEVLDFYFHQCSLEMTCHQVANAFMMYANKGRVLETNEEIITMKEVKRINAIMQTCGFYDEAGEFSYRVGLPGKSGVGGGIAAVHPGEYAVAVWSPLLNQKGNSKKGMIALEELTGLTGLSIF